MGKLRSFTGKPLTDTSLVDLLTDDERRTSVYMTANGGSIHHIPTDLTLVGINDTPFIKEPNQYDHDQNCRVLIDPKSIYAYYIDPDEQLLRLRQLRAHLFLHADRIAEKHIWEGTFQEAIDEFISCGYHIC